MAFLWLLLFVWGFISLEKGSKFKNFQFKYMRKRQERHCHSALQFRSFFCHKRCFIFSYFICLFPANYLITSVFFNVYFYIRIFFVCIFSGRTHWKYTRWGTRTACLTKVPRWQIDHGEYIILCPVKIIWNQIFI